jgi:hypothetical protein
MNLLDTIDILSQRSGFAFEGEEISLTGLDANSITEQTASPGSGLVSL